MKYNHNNTIHTKNMTVLYKLGIVCCLLHLQGLYITFRLWPLNLYPLDARNGTLALIESFMS